MSQLDIPFKYEDTPKKELTPEELIYISEIKQGNFKHVCFLPHTQDELTELLCQDT
ncbi:MAG: hypothetical protein LBH96_01570 [Candidatus Peribacteria bacterium]|jgi:hypothetical protein|nr:hypothetical protein [Candidatus Peribacteria bacterium]